MAVVILVLLAVGAWATQRRGPQTEPMQLKAEPDRVTQAAPRPAPAEPAASAAQAQPPQPTATPPQPSPSQDQVARDSDQDQDEANPENEAAAPQSSRTSVTLSTVPARTSVYRGGQSEGTTPLTFGVSKGERVVLRLVKKGYATQSVVLDGSQAKVRVVMLKEGSSRGGHEAVR
jgi:type IV secretory pathway VirB10-like protein